jgi:hypothetical protein
MGAKRVVSWVLDKRMASAGYAVEREYPSMKISATLRWSLVQEQARGRRAQPWQSLGNCALTAS